MYKFIAKLTTLSLFFIVATGCSKTSQVWIPGWKETSILSIARAGAGIAQHGDVIYMIGGVDGRGFLGTTEFARIQKDGSLSPWQAGPALNEERGFTDAVAHNGWVYVVGGGNGPNGHNLLRSAERAKIQPDGSLGPWIVESNLMNLPRRCSKVIATDKGLYSFGGFSGGLLDNVEHALFSADGSLGVWQLEAEVMTMPRYVNGMKAMGDAVYLVGGHNQNSGVGVTQVEWSRIQASGAFDKWQATSAMQIGRYGLSTASHGANIYALGGITGAEYVNSVERSTRAKDGALTAWTMTTPLSQPLTNFNVLVSKDWIYVFGGTNRSGYSRAVQYSTFNAEGDVGYWGSKAEELAHQEKLTARVAIASQLPNSGVVREVQHTQAYSYVLAEGPEGTAWLAGPKTQLAIGDRIHYSQGVLMAGFFSKELQQTFPTVLFVGTITVDP